MLLERRCGQWVWHTLLLGWVQKVAPQGCFGGPSFLNWGGVARVGSCGLAHDKSGVESLNCDWWVRCLLVFLGIVHTELDASSVFLDQHVQPDTPDTCRAAKQLRTHSRHNAVGIRTCPVSGLLTPLGFWPSESQEVWPGGRKLLVTSASLLVTSALLAASSNKCHATRNKFLTSSNKNIFIRIVITSFLLLPVRHLLLLVRHL